MTCVPFLGRSLPSPLRTRKRPSLGGHQRGRPPLSRSKQLESPRRESNPNTTNRTPKARYGLGLIRRAASRAGAVWRSTHHKAVVDASVIQSILVAHQLDVVELVEDLLARGVGEPFPPQVL